MVPLYAACKTLTLRNSLDLDDITGLKHTYVYFLPDLVILHIIQPEFSQVPVASVALQMSFLRFCKFLGLTKADLYCVILILFCSFYLRNTARTGFNSRYSDFKVLPVKLRHAYFLTKYASHFYRSYNLISISTPDGSCSCVRASMVFVVGPTISISLL